MCCARHRGRSLDGIVGPGAVAPTQVCLGWLVGQVATQMGAVEAAAQALLGGGDVLIEDVVGAGYDGDGTPAPIAHDRGGGGIRGLEAPQKQLLSRGQHYGVVQG